ncbi:alpha/beta hydrolase [Dyella sp. BiH032]|uniref:alpha/beta fold hydrolase n=1 Tax=Dyella sp. BiH032 TaxID=3075430 RepID=UPI00289347A9|nr:alpha/beta hydrolase [Dyella sp. BiH032]WNL44272.1 alpha/beta hydrolase [Dyella sp. BiH032]
MKKLFAGLAMAAAMVAGQSAFAQTAMPMQMPDKAYIVLVHGAFADGSSWNDVARILRKDGYFVIAAANPLRGVKSDGQYVASLVGALKGPVVLVGHSYGGSVITEAANGRPNVKALVYVSAFSPDTGETVAGLAGKFPGSTLGQALAPAVTLPDGSKDLYILQDKFRAQFAADVPAPQAALMAVTQRPVTEAALNEPSGEAAWKTLPSWHIYGSADKNIPPEAMAFMAMRAHARDVVVVKGASHVVMVSHPDAVARLIEEAAKATQASQSAQ